MSVDLRLVETTLQALLTAEPVDIRYICRASGKAKAVPADKAADRGGYLPAILTAASALWREATGLDLGVEIKLDPKSVLGFAVTAIHSDQFSVVMLLAQEALRACRQPHCYLLNVLAEVSHNSTAIADRLISARAKLPAIA